MQPGSEQAAAGAARAARTSSGVIVRSSAAARSRTECAAVTAVPPRLARFFEPDSPTQQLARRLARGRPPRLSGGRQRARRVPRPRPRRLRHRHHDRRPARRDRAARCKGWADAVWLQGERFGTVGCQKDGEPLRDHDVPRRDLPRRQPQAGGHVLRRHRDRPVAPRLHHQRDGDRARRARARRSARRPRRPRGPPAAHAALARDLVRRRPAAHVARGAVRRDARLRARRRSASHAIEQMRERLQIISAERIRDELSKLLARRRSVGRALADRAHEARRRVPARAERDGARAGSDPPAQGRARAHDRGRRQDLAALEAPARRAAARRRQAAARAATGRRA